MRNALRSTVLGALLLGGVAGCGLRRGSPSPEPGPLVVAVRTVLAAERPSPQFYRERGELETMGPLLDAILYTLAFDRSVDPTVRGNALLLLADRRPLYAVSALRRALLTSEEEAVRASAVSGLQRLAPVSPAAARAIRSAIGDPSPRVRLTVLRTLDVEDVETIRALFQRERDPQIRTIARQLIGLAESRGAPLVADSAGDLRATVPDGSPQIVFHPMESESALGVATGAVWVELSRGRLRPLGQGVEVVNGVIPAFLSPDSASVVFEAGREIRVRDLRTGRTRIVGPGIAPRVVPFTPWFVFLEERPGVRQEVPGGTELVYEVLRARFGGGSPEQLGTLRATVRSDRHANASPVRWMVVGESPGGFELRGEGVSTFALPHSSGPAPRPEAPPGR